MQGLKEPVEEEIRKVIGHKHKITFLRPYKIERYVPIRGSPCLKTGIRQETIHNAQDAFVVVND
ncbi:MAG: hypothetical protein WBQ85_12845 [Candidatus Sulfotelmatobacter sp.]